MQAEKAQAVRSSRNGWLIPVAMCVVLVATCAIYFHALDSTPLVVTVDEARVGLHANAIVTKGTDLAGNRWPVFFHITDPLNPADDSETWWQPALFYLAAAVFRFAPPTEWSLRLPTTILAIINVILIYFVARKLFSKEWYALVAAGLLGLTPAHYMFARRALDVFCALPIALAWLFCLVAYAESATPWLTVAMGLLLGLGLFTHISSWIVMPGYLAVTCLVLRRLSAPPKAFGGLAAGFAVPLAMLVPALVMRPSLPAETFSHYKVPAGWLIAERIDVYWSFLDPSYLFFSGGPHPIFATQRGGVLVVAAVVLLPLGIWSVLHRSRDLRRDLLLFGFFFAPLPVALALPQDPKYYTPRDLLVMPYAALLCTIGLEWLFDRKSWAARLFGAVLLLSVPSQFLGFAKYYLNGYQQASAPRIDPLNLEDVAEYVISADRASNVPLIYLSEDVGSTRAYQWAFYLLERHREDVWARTRHFDSRSRSSDIPGGSLLVFDATDRRLDQIKASMGCSLLHVVSAVNGDPATAVLRRN